jgi:hypothetical protein
LKRSNAPQVASHEWIPHDRRWDLTNIYRPTLRDHANETTLPRAV